MAFVLSCCAHLPEDLLKYLDPNQLRILPSRHSQISLANPIQYPNQAFCSKIQIYHHDIRVCYYHRSSLFFWNSRECYHHAHLTYIHTLSYLRCILCIPYGSYTHRLAHIHCLDN